MNLLQVAGLLLGLYAHHLACVRSADRGGMEVGTKDTVGDSKGIWDGVGISIGDVGSVDQQGGWLHALSGGVQLCDAVSQYRKGTAGAWV